MAIAVRTGVGVAVAVGVGVGRRTLAAGEGDGSSEHPVNRMASTAMPISSLLIGFDTAFTSSASLSGTLLAPHPSTLGLGGSAWPKSLLPQHSTEPSVLTPQLWNHPALTEENSPAGGVAWPTKLPSPLLLPQHSTEPSRLTPQLWSHPALTEVKEPSGGVA